MCVHEWAQIYHRRKVRMHAEGGTYTRQPGGQSTSAGAATPFAAAGIFLDTCRLAAH